MAKLTKNMKNSWYIQIKHFKKFIINKIILFNYLRWPSHHIQEKTFYLRKVNLYKHHILLLFDIKWKERRLKLCIIH